jgi:hypothetical protein
MRVYKFIAEKMSSGTPFKISIIASYSLAHMLVLLKNSDYGPGSLLPPGARHGMTLHASANLAFEAESALIHVTSDDIAAVVTYAVRSVANPLREYCTR